MDKVKILVHPDAKIVNLIETKTILRQIVGGESRFLFRFLLYFFRRFLQFPAVIAGILDILLREK